MKSKLEQIVEESLQEEVEEGGGVFDPTMIMGIITAIFTFIQQCRGGARTAKAAIKTGSDAAKIAAYSACVKAGYPGHRGRLAMRIAEKGTAATDEDIDEFMHTAHSLPDMSYMSGVFMIIAAMIFGCCQTTLAGPATSAAEYAIASANQYTHQSAWIVADLDAQPATARVTETRREYRPTGGERFVETQTGATSLRHLVEHGYDPQIVSNTPRQYWDLLHGDAHRGRRSTVVEVKQPMRQVTSFVVGASAGASNACPPGMT